MSLAKPEGGGAGGTAVIEGVEVVVRKRRARQRAQIAFGDVRANMIYYDGFHCCLSSASSRSFGICRL